MSIDLNASYFDLFELPTEFEVDTENLSVQYRKLQAEYHPDRFARADDKQRLLSVQNAARINEAYNVLTDPLQRGFYLLKLAGVSVSDEQHTNSDGAFLMQQMELRERLEEAGELSDPLDEFDAIRSEVKQLEADLYQLFCSAYEAKMLDDALEHLKKIQFFTRLKSQLDDSEARYEDELLS